jgi:hypothetical protein
MVNDILPNYYLSSPNIPPSGDPYDLGKSITSPMKGFELIFQPDDNVVVYALDDSKLPNMAYGWPGGMCGPQ